jgi:hypothetical protein
MAFSIRRAACVPILLLAAVAAAGVEKGQLGGTATFNGGDIKCVYRFAGNGGSSVIFVLPDGNHGIVALTLCLGCPKPLPGSGAQRCWTPPKDAGGTSYVILNNFAIDGADPNTGNSTWNVLPPNPITQCAKCDANGIHGRVSAKKGDPAGQVYIQ